MGNAEAWCRLILGSGLVALERFFDWCSDKCHSAAIKLIGIEAYFSDGG